MGKITIGHYQVEEEESFYGIKIWALHLGTDIVLFDYMGKDFAANRYFFKSRKKLNWIVVYSREGMFSEVFHPFLLDLDKIVFIKEEPDANV